MKKLYAFYIPYLLFVITLFVLVIRSEKADLHLWITSFNAPETDAFFKYYTHMGGFVPYLAVFILLFFSYSRAMFVLGAQIVAGLVSVILKRTFDEPRPLAYFREYLPDVQLYQVAGERLYTSHSFPSGHTIAAFTFFFSLVFFTRRPALHFVYFVLALLAGYSRVYLSQHFAADVLAGSLIGVFMTFAWRHYYARIPMDWAEGSLQDVVLRKKAPAGVKIIK